ncbi:sensor histidine kinase [Azospirillum halopraeferens]|uniref:sensor histidine kinase n=1 Tax=Azospirillum halopraeferens TaxID=34010 RepID=UPI000686B717|nr:HAMP domain-containing sensor histidine kinase [Azospirillum halopraeferens]
MTARPPSRLPPRSRPRSWPLAVTVPLLVAALMAAVGAAVSYSVLTRLAADQEAHLRDLAAARLDGLAVALQPHVARQDVWEAFDMLDRVRRRGGGIDVRVLMVMLPDGSVLAATDPVGFPVGSDLPADLRAHLDAPAGLVIDAERRRAWSHRALGGAGHVLAEMDIAPLVAVRREVLTTLLLLNGGLTLLFAAVGYALVGRLLRPLRVLDHHVERVRTGRVTPIPARFIAGAGGEFGRLFDRFNAMAEAVAEREALARRLADEEKLALLGRLASGMAHEVNNPLGGLLTAVDTLKRHGDDAAVRLRTAALLERGLCGIGNVVRAALVTYKEPPGGGAMAPDDLDDLRFLIGHEAQRRRVALDWRNRLPPGPLPVDGAAVRQMALNLLLNACRAVPPGGRVALDAAAADGVLILTVADGGPGLPPAMAELLRSRGTAPLPRGGGLGLWTVARLLERTGGTVAVDAGPGRGTAVTLTIPFPDARPSHADAAE